ncbi:DEAD/DEAH box helicase family protein [Actinomadura pelletieri]|uniref:DEAD/DEAH box helicase family protein n=1 Tax=Actinomadura pelletieri TaxID=111805 RepID=UPI0014770593|nr:DEAD/DEAH box helicase family protein [Actinomadura pelletieri]
MSGSAEIDEGLRHLKDEYRSGTDALDSGFFRPCLKLCNSYDRAVGYFTSHALVAWAEGVIHILEDPGVRIRLVIGPTLLPEDKAALAGISDERVRTQYCQRLADDLLKGSIAELKRGSSTARLELFCWLIANERLQLRFAFPAHIENADSYHEKFGIFSFSNDRHVAFTGSANETIGGYRKNFEYVDVFRSWVSEDRRRVISKIEKFKDTWAGVVPGLKIRHPSSSVIAEIKALGGTYRPTAKGSKPPLEPENRWRHQDHAIEAFLTSRRGILEMATGTGKTRTALRIASRLVSSSEVNGLIVSTEGTDLLDQWSLEVRNSPTLRELVLYRHYSDYHELGRFTLSPQRSVLLCSRYALPQLKKALSDNDKSDLLIVHDEVHGFGSAGLRARLSGFHNGFAAVLGLSATPERDYDEEGNDFIEREIGTVCFTFGLKKAIENGILCPFEYVPIEYDLTDGDRRRLQQVYGRKAAAEASGQPWSDEKLYREISMVYKTAELKPQRFRELVNERPDLLKAAIAFVETKDYAENFLDAVASITSAYSTYFDTDPQARLKELSRGELDCLICCKRLSEGVDIQHLQNVILVSSDRAKLRTIQRIGRTLRRDPHNPEKVATVVDFVLKAAPADHSDSERRRWLEELSQIRLS